MRVSLHMIRSSWLMKLNVLKFYIDPSRNILQKIAKKNFSLKSYAPRRKNMKQEVCDFVLSLEKEYKNKFKCGR